MKKLVFFLLAITVFTSIYSQNAFLNKHLAKGKYDVGFKRIWEIDNSRIFERSKYLDSIEGSLGRPIRIDVWYPALDKNGNTMLFQQYVYPETTSKEFEDLNFLTKRWDVYSYKGLAEDSIRFQKLMNTKLSVIKDAQPVNKKFPLIVYSAGWFNRSPDNTILAEFLASNGFVVATIPQLNAGLWTYNFNSDFKSVENQTRDLEFALGRLLFETNVDRTKIAAMGYSTGGDVALLLQSRNKLIDCVIGMDASWSISANNDVINSPFADFKKNQVPLLILRRENKKEKTYNTVLDSLKHSKRYIIEFDKTNHGSFSDDPSQRELLNIESTSSSKAQALIAKTILAFLNFNFYDLNMDFKRKIQDLGLQIQTYQKEE